MNPKLHEKCRLLAACTAPEVLPVTILDFADHPILNVRSAWGWACLQRNHYLRRELIEAGLWDGAASLVALNMAEIEGTATEYGMTVEQATLQVMVHELAHLVPREAPIAVDPPSEQEIVDHQIQYENHASGQPLEAELPWTGHGGKFVRFALHLWHRANEAGFDVPLDGLCGGMGYRLAPAWRYLESLGSEPMRMIGLPFSLIANEELPEAFVEQFDDDTEFFYEFQMRRHR